MRWLRSWPANPPAGRAHVVDDMERLVIDNYDYTPLGSIDDDVCLLEWDMALSPGDMQSFALHAIESRNSVQVAPYPLYHVAPFRSMGGGVWAHRRVWRHSETWVETGTPDCDYAAFGCIYLPRDAVRAFLASEAPARGRDPRLPADAEYSDRRFTDQTFSVWHHWHAKRGPIPVHWDVRPVHLHW